MTRLQGTTLIALVTALIVTQIVCACVILRGQAEARADSAKIINILGASDTDAVRSGGSVLGQNRTAGFGATSIVAIHAIEPNGRR